MKKTILAGAALALGSITQAQPIPDPNKMVNHLCKIDNCTDEQETIIKELMGIADEFRIRIGFMMNHKNETLYITDRPMVIVALTKDNIMKVCNPRDIRECRNLLTDEGEIINSEKFIEKYRELYSPKNPEEPTPEEFI